MKSSIKVLIIFAVVIFFLLTTGVSSYNNLVTLSENVKINYSQIENQLQRRNDLIPNLVETVKVYASHEKEVFTQISDARSRLAGAKSISEIAEGDAALSNAIGRLLAISENYPQLKANENFIQLQDELAGTENRISTARRDYNLSAQEYNTAIKKFPTVIFAKIFGFGNVEYFEASEGAHENPDVGELFE